MPNTALKKTQSAAHVSVNMTVTMDLNCMCNTHHTCIIKRDDVYFLTSHTALLFHPTLIGAVCSCSLHFHCSLPSLVSTHLHLRSARWGPLSSVTGLTTTSSWLLYLILCPLESVYTLFPSLSAIVSCWWYMRQGLLVQRGSLCAGSLSGEVSVCLSHHSGEVLETGGHHKCRLHPLEQRQDSPRRKTGKAVSMSGRALCWEASRLKESGRRQQQREDSI